MQYSNDDSQIFGCQLMNVYIIKLSFQDFVGVRSETLRQVHFVAVLQGRLCYVTRDT